MQLRINNNLEIYVYVKSALMLFALRVVKTVINKGTFMLKLQEFLNNNGTLNI